jgi:hypothetical protein
VVGLLGALILLVNVCWMAKISCFYCLSEGDDDAPSNSSKFSGLTIFLSSFFSSLISSFFPNIPIIQFPILKSSFFLSSAFSLSSVISSLANLSAFFSAIYVCSLNLIFNCYYFATEMFSRPQSSSSSETYYAGLLFSIFCVWYPLN